MSKLFDTLERIRQNEEAPSSAMASKAQIGPSSGHRPSLRLAVVGGGLVLAAILVYTLLPLMARRPQIDPPAAQAPPAPRLSSLATGEAAPPHASQPEPTAAPAARPSFDSELARANNDGAALVRQEEYPKGIANLRRAAALAPDRIEPFINLGVACAESGQVAEAVTHFERAYAIDPVHPVLVANLLLLDQAGLLRSSVIDRASLDGLLPPAEPQVR